MTVFLFSAIFRLEIRRTLEDEEDEMNEDGKKESRLHLLPTLILRHVASNLTPKEVLDGLLIAFPSLFEDLRNGIAWTRLDYENYLEHLRHLVLVSADDVNLATIAYKPSVDHLAKKWDRVVKGKRVKTVVVLDPKLVEGDSQDALAMAGSSLLTNVFLSQFTRLECIKLWNYGAELDALFDMVSGMLRKTPATMKSVICRSSWRREVVVPDKKLRELFEQPGHSVQFRIFTLRKEENSNIHQFYFELTRN